MIEANKISEMLIPQKTKASFSDHSINGIPIPKINRVLTFSPSEWEEFIEEWASFIIKVYKKVRRMGGAGDLGIDIAAFKSDIGFLGEWDNYQCKRYDHPLYPSDIWVEIGKIVYYSFNKEYLPPKKHYFICSKGIGTTLERLFNDAPRLKNQAKENWDEYCRQKITTTKEILLSGELLDYFENFNFSIFDSKSLNEIIDEHSKTEFHTVRFGGGLPQRPRTLLPPFSVKESNMHYIRQIFKAYSEYLGKIVYGIADVNNNSELKDDFLRQRERFFEAEALRNFSRDTVPRGTFESLQKEILYGVIDTCNKSYQHGLERIRETLGKAASIHIQSNPLAIAITLIDKQGICHQLADENKLLWVQPKGKLNE